MSLRFKTILMIGVTLTILVAVTAQASAALYSRFLLQFEERDTRREVQIAIDAIADEADKLSLTTQDYGAWTDAYEFMADRNEEFRDNNVPTVTVTRLNLSQIAYLLPTGEPLHASAKDRPHREIWFLPGLEHRLRPDDPLLRRPLSGETVVGLALLDDGPVIIAAHPVLTSDNQGPPRGVLIMARDLDKLLVSKLGLRLDTPLQVWRLDGQGPAPDPEVAAEVMADRTARPVVPLSDQEVAGYARLDDIDGNPALLLRVDTRRDIYRQGQESLRYLTIVTVTIGVILAGVVLVMMARLVLTPLARLNRGVQSIGTSGDSAMRLAISGKDELAQLAGAINDMLDALERSRARAEQLEQQTVDLEQQLQKLHIQIDEAKKARDVAEITETTYFHYLQNRAREMRTRRSTTPTPQTG